MKLQLNTWQILTCQGIIGSCHGNVELVRKAAKCLDALELNADQMKQAGLEFVVKDEVGRPLDDRSFWRWTNHAIRFDVEIADRNAADFFRQTIKNHNQWSPKNAKAISDLFDQLEKE